MLNLTIQIMQVETTMTIFFKLCLTVIVPLDTLAIIIFKNNVFTITKVNQTMSPKLAASFSLVYAKGY